MEETPKTKTLSVSMPSTMHDNIKKHCDDNGYTESEYIRSLVRADLDQYKLPLEKQLQK